MRKLLTCIFAIIFTSPAVVGATGEFSRVIPSDSSDGSASTATTRTAKSRIAVARPVATSAQDSNTTVSSRTATTDSVRGTVSRVFSGGASVDSGTQTRGAVSRSRGAVSGARSGLDTAVNTVGRNERVSAASINSNPAVRRAG